MEPWHNEFLDLMFGKKRTPETMSKAAEIKYQHMPESLYKFRRFSENAISALNNDCLFSAGADYLNDIREAPIMILSDKLKQQALQKAYDEARIGNPRLPEAIIRDAYDLAAQLHSIYALNCGDHALPSPSPGADAFIDSLVAYVNDASRILLERELRNIRNMYNVCCFSAIRDEDLMWAHYADSHKGFCIEYDFRSFGVMDERVQLLFPIIYQDAPSIVIDDLKEADGSLAMYALTLKRTYWEYENEWRSFYFHTEKPNPEPMPKPKAIYLGVRCNNDNRQQMIEICMKKCISLFQMNLDSINTALVSQRIL